MALVWTNPTKSGLGDRLIDLFIIASMASLYDKHLYLYWPEQPINNIQKKVWNTTRFDDYKIENVKKYFNIPLIIHIQTYDEIKSLIATNNVIIFNSYIGGTYSPYSFYDKFIDKKYSITEYIDIFNNIIHQFTPTNTLLQYIINIPNNLISVHLRRTDKMSRLIYYGEAHGVNPDDQHLLDNMTHEIIKKVLLKDKFNIHFASDDILTKKQYIEKYKNTININFYNNFIDTYIDIYLMSISKYIILSQRHSSFSLFASMINQSKLIYLYNNDIIVNAEYTKFKNILFKDQI